MNKAESKRHTPGEWEIKGNKIFLKGKYICIATVSVVKNYEDVTFNPIQDVEMEANARLISAAPSLLAENEKLKEQVKELREALSVTVGQLKKVEPLYSKDKQIIEIAEQAMNNTEAGNSLSETVAVRQNEQTKEVCPKCKSCFIGKSADGKKYRCGYCNDTGQTDWLRPLRR